MHDFKSIAVYFDKNGNLIGIPSTLIEKWNILANIDDIVRLYAPYCDEEIESFLKMVFDKCYSQTLTELPKQSVLRKLLGTKSDKAAVKELGLVGLRWLKSEGYMVTPTWSNARVKSAFAYMEDKTIRVSTTFLDGELANAFKEAMDISPIGPLYAKPE